MAENCFRRGHNFEKCVRDILEREGYTTWASTKQEDMYGHIDFWAIGNDESTYSIDAKAMKSLQRGEPVQDIWAFVEWLNVRGDVGWLVKGADILAFERSKDIVLVWRKHLKSFCEQRTNFETHSFSPKTAHYKCYSRPSRRDLISLFKFSDLTIPLKTFQKDKDLHTD